VYTAVQTLLALCSKAGGAGEPLVALLLAQALLAGLLCQRLPQPDCCLMACAAAAEPTMALPRMLQLLREQTNQGSMHPLKPEMRAGANGQFARPP
jgi:hypothetical protein